VNKSQPTTAELTIMIAGAAMLIGSFLGFYEHTASAWGTGLFPIATLLPIYGVVMAAQIAVARFTQVQLPPRVAGFTWEQVHAILGLLAVILAVLFLAVDNAGLGAGIVIDFLAAIGLAVGAFRLQQERNTGMIG